MGDHAQDGGQALTGDDTASPERQAAARLEAGRLLFAHECTFVMGAVGLDALPGDVLPEIAFAGRSNVGKSSLINALTGRSLLARVSNTPGRTQELNFFRLDQRLMMVDLPGYGFAKAPKDQVRRWTHLIMAYLKGRAPLRRVCLLVDSRHGLKDTDRETMRLLDKSAVVYQVVLTKADKVSAAALDEVRQRTTVELAGHPAAHPEVLITSAEKGTGLPELRATLTDLALPTRSPP